MTGMERVMQLWDERGEIIERQQAEIERLRALIAVWADAEDEAHLAAERCIKASEIEFLNGQLERYRNALRKAVGR